MIISGFDALSDQTIHACSLFFVMNFAVFTSPTEEDSARLLRRMQSQCTSSDMYTTVLILRLDAYRLFEPQFDRVEVKI